MISILIIVGIIDTNQGIVLITDDYNKVIKKHYKDINLSVIVISKEDSIVKLLFLKIIYYKVFKCSITYNYRDNYCNEVMNFASDERIIFISDFDDSLNDNKYDYLIFEDKKVEKKYLTKYKNKNKIIDFEKFLKKI